MPQGKRVTDLPLSHFKTLTRKHGFPSISRSLTALHVLNKNRNKPLSRWADKMQADLSRWNKGIRTVRRINPCPKPIKKAVNPKRFSSKAYLYRIYTLKVIGMSIIKKLDRTSFTVSLKHDSNLKTVLSILKDKNILKPSLDDKLFSMRNDKYAFYIRYANNPEFELRREDIYG